LLACLPACLPACLFACLLGYLSGLRACAYIPHNRFSSLRSVPHRLMGLRLRGQKGKRHNRVVLRAIEPVRFQSGHVLKFGKIKLSRKEQKKSGASKRRETFLGKPNFPSPLSPFFLL